MQRRGYLLMLAAAMALYLATMAPGVLWQDSGLAQVRVLRRDLAGHLGLALAHPLYYLLGISFQVLPFAESAFKTNLVSAVFGAVTVANVFALVAGLTGCRRAAIIAAGSLAVAHTFWQHCALAEVYSVSTALLTAELLCLMRYDRTRRGGWLVALFLLNGLGISNHMLASLSLLCYAGLLLWLVTRRMERPATLAVCALAWAAGASLYLGLIGVEAARTGDWADALQSALFGNYQSQVLNLLPSARQMIESGLILGLNFPTPAVLLVIPGAAALRTSAPRRFAAVLTALLAVHLLWAIRYDVPDRYTFFIPAVVLLSVVMGLGADRFLRARRSRAWPAALLLAPLLAPAVYAALPALAGRLDLALGVSREIPYRDPHAYFLHPWKAGYHGARRFAEQVHATLPEGALLWADSTTASPIHYLQLTGRWTRDVRVNPPFELTPEFRAAVVPEALEGLLAAGRLYVVTPQPGYTPQWLLERCTFERFGPVYRAILQGAD